MDDAAAAVAGAEPSLAKAKLGPLDAPQLHLQRCPAAALHHAPLAVQGYLHAWGDMHVTLCRYAAHCLTRLHDTRN